MKNWKKIIAGVAAFFALADLPVHASAIGEVELRPSTKGTYAVATGLFTAAASATDVWQLYAGPNKIVRVLKVWYCDTDTGSAASYNNVSLIKRSTANSGGTPVTNTQIPLDSSFAASDAVSKHYTANPTTGTTVATISQIPVSGSTQTGVGPYNGLLGGANLKLLFDSAIHGAPIVLRGTGQGIVINLNGATQAGTSPKFFVQCIWTEDTQ